MQKILLSRENISVRFDKEQEAIYCYFKPKDRYCFTYSLMLEVLSLHQAIKDYFHLAEENRYKIKYLIYMSQIDNIFSYGGDLLLFADSIEHQDKDHILKYGKLANNIVYDVFTRLSLPIITISVIDGLALGGGFEAVLATNITIATQKSSFSLPDTKFNLFPGAGAFTLLSRMVGETKARKMIVDGDLYSAKELFELGIIDYVIDKGEDIESYLSKFLKKNIKSFKSQLSIREVADIQYPLNQKMLYDILELWVQKALELKHNDIKKMRRFVRGQENKNSMHNLFIRTMQDRRFFNINKFPIQTLNGQINSERRLSQRRKVS